MRRTNLTAIDDKRFARFLVMVNAAVPGVLLALDAVQHRLGANPVNFAILTTGMSTLVFLTLSLLVTPVRRITGWNQLIFIRRPLGLFAFFYACAHFLIFFVFDRALSLSSTGAEMINRPYLVIGTLGLVSMAPLAVTSTDAMVKRLGAKRWQLLHRLAYVAATAGVVHFYMQSKADKRLPLAFAAALAILFAYRAVATIADRRKKRALPVVATSNRPRIWRGELRVARIRQETHNVRTFRLEAADGGAFPFEHKPGQFLNLSLQIDGGKVNRSYTIASSPTLRHACEITVKREEGGTASRHLHDKVREGDTIPISAPAGRFTFDGTESRCIVLIGGGVGITPLMSILRSLTDREWRGEIHLVYSVREARDIIFAAEIESLSRKHENLHVHITVTRPDDSWGGHRRRIDADLLRGTVPDLTQPIFYVCGPTEMMDSVQQILGEFGVPEDRVRSEAFVHPSRGAAKSEADDREAAASSTAEIDNPATVHFTHSDTFTEVQPGLTILEAGEACGLDLDYDCRSGICGTCRKRLLKGSVTMEVEEALSAKDKAEGQILLCQAKPRGPVTVEA